MDALVIEDDKNIREDLATILTESGLFRRVVEAADGMVASQKIRNQEFAFILLDINLPKMDGLALLKEMKTSGHQLMDRVLIVSGHLDAEVLKVALKNGVRNYLVKPFDPASLKVRIEALLAK